jgi:hypothetical protein
MSRILNARQYRLGDQVVIFGDLHWMTEGDKSELDRLNVGDQYVTLAGTPTVRLPDPRLPQIPRTVIAGDCRCCGAHSAPEAPILRANVRDADGEYYPRLCSPCFDDFEDYGYFDRPDDKLQIAVDLLGDDQDGIAMMFT